MKLVIFNQDLRIRDNLAFFSACQKSAVDRQIILPIFIFDQINKRPIGGASKWFLANALRQLDDDLQKDLSLKLLIFKGHSLEIVKSILKQNQISEIYFNRLYEPDNLNLQKQIKDLANSLNIKVFDYKSYLLFEPEEIKNEAGSYFKVFTPFWKKCLNSWQLTFKSSEELLVVSKSSSGQSVILQAVKSIKLEDLNLIPSSPNWSLGFEKFWVFNHETILSNFNNFLKKRLANYKSDRNFPALDATSKLAPYLHFGLISINQVVDLVKKYHQKYPQSKEGVACFLSELGWREFSYHLLYHFPKLPLKNFKEQFDNFSWNNNQDLLVKWQKGKTGYPIIDAGIRELWQTGFMHNRVRMIVASFLIKDLLIDWRFGEEWFWDCLCDANLANNSAGWQWVAGSGADAAPYYRIFNPVLQGKKFDPQGDYVKKWIPELKNIPVKFIHNPWQLSNEDAKKFGLFLGENYPQRIVIHEEARIVAMSNYKALTKIKNDVDNKKS